MKLNDLFAKFNLENSLLIGFYGGGNYGDELLLEVLLNLLDAQGLKRITITYQNPDGYQTFHHDFGYTRINMHNMKQLLEAVFRHKNIIVGGGGLWGLDVNPNILRLGVMLFISRWVLQKRVYLLGVGYYNSTPKLGHLGAWFAGKSANYIIARDQESHDNFRKITKHVSLDTDMAWHIPRVELDHYRHDVQVLERDLQITQKTIFITLRRFKDERGKAYFMQISRCLAENKDKHFIVAIMEPREIDPENYAQLEDWQKTNRNVQIFDFAFNPLALALLLRKCNKHLTLIGPQFHLILSAHLAHVPFLPITYDNKVSQLLSQLGYAEAIPIASITDDTIQTFVDDFYKDG